VRGERHSFKVFACYCVETSAKRTLYLMFRGRAANEGRLWFTSLDPPYEDIFLKPRHIRAARQIGANRL
jgi:hypothetical protein